MKKNKFSRNTSSSSQNNSPILTRKYNEQDATSLGVSPLDTAAADLLEGGAVLLDKSRTRSNSYNIKDHGYETIPADAMRVAAGTTGAEQNRKSDCYTNILQKERQIEGGKKLWICFNEHILFLLKYFTIISFAKMRNFCDFHLTKFNEILAFFIWKQWLVFSKKLSFY